MGGEGAVLRYDGTAWSEMTSGTSERLRAVWGLSPDDVYAAGENGTILHYDGTAWTPMSSGTAGLPVTGSA